MNRCPVKRSIRGVVALGIAVGLYFLAAKFCQRQTDSFTIGAISSNRPFDPQWQTRPLSAEEQKEIDVALSQHYHYFGKGGQAYAFFSEDGQYVLKFFKQRVYTIPLWHHFIPIPYLFDRYKEKKRWKRQDKLQRDFFSYKTAFEELQEITGVLYVNLNSAEKLKRTVSIVDRLGIEHQLPLDQFDFVLQRRAEMIYPTISRLVENHEMDRAKQIIDEVIALIVYRCQKGYEDWDANVRTNCGLLHDRIIKIDVGRFISNEKMKKPEVCHAELVRIMTPFQVWLNTQEPALAAYCEEAIGRVHETGL